MSKGNLLDQVLQFANTQYQNFNKKYGQQVVDIVEIPISILVSPITIAYHIAGSAPRGYGISEFISKVSYSSIFAIATLGSLDIALELGKKALITLDPDRARNDPVVVKNVPYYKAKKTLEMEVMKLDPPPRPADWGVIELNLPLDSSSWSKDDLKDPKKQNEMTVLLNAQREIAEKILDSQWEAKWRQDKLNEMMEEKVQPYIQNVESLSQPIIMHPPSEDKKKRSRQRRWWLF